MIGYYNFSEDYDYLWSGDSREFVYEPVMDADGYWIYEVQEPGLEQPRDWLYEYLDVLANASDITYVEFEIVSVDYGIDSLEMRFQ